MRRRVQKRKRRITERAIANGDEPPDPVTALLVAGAAVATGTGLVVASKAKKSQKRAEESAMRQRDALLASAKKPVVVPKKDRIKAGETTKLSPGQKIDLISTSPEGILQPASTGRATLLGN